MLCTLPPVEFRGLVLTSGVADSGGSSSSRLPGELQTKSLNIYMYVKIFAPTGARGEPVAEETAAQVDFQGQTALRFGKDIYLF